MVKAVSSSEINKPKVAEMSMRKGKSRIPGRKTLADISNMPQGFTASNQFHKSGSSSDALRKHLEQLQKENAALMKHLADKNKVIESGGTEMQKLRVILEKVKQQNLQLAQSNSQMLAVRTKFGQGKGKYSRKMLGNYSFYLTFNSGHIHTTLFCCLSQQKALNHELGCKNGLIIAKNLEMEHNTVTEPEDTEVCTVAEGDDNKHYTNIRRQISENLIQSNKKIQDNDKGKSKRLQTRRQSAKFKLDDPKPTQDSLKIDDIDDVPPCSFPADDDNDQVKVNDSNAGTSSSSSSKMEDKEGESFQDFNNPQEHKRTSLSRPVREAAKKVQSYKEVNLIVKMRRE
ncbi:hypothetical protein L1987_11413 [Smallanthus sonchifolius]|uniref:Uncharacterized protein n=1 Tax=Smallanthus sonchifolius TaxID=185202 RepID=A0ACB9JEC4_9ASTR|nr:hypothetical protein L1987_11413 [Smallanthus sonchifolius]